MLRGLRMLLTQPLRRLRCRNYRTKIVILVAILNIIFVISLYRRAGSTNSHYHRPEVVPGQRRLRHSHVVPTKSDPEMDELDAMLLQKNVSVTPVYRGRCSNFTTAAPPIDLQENFWWQPVQRGQRETFVFSAYYDPRTIPAVVRIVGVSSGLYQDTPTSTAKYCQLWFEGDLVPQVTQAEYIIVPETHERRYAASFHICYLTLQSRIPYAVSLSSEACKPPSNILRVIDNDMTRSPDVNYTVCVTPFNFNYDNYHQLVEMVETNKLFGAQRFIFYNYSTGSSILPYLRSYQDDGTALVIPWRVPVEVDPWPPDAKVEPEIHYFGQLASLNDCLYRSMFRSRFVVYSDMDEIIVPQNNDTWSAMLDSVTRDWQRSFRFKNNRLYFPGGYLIRSSFFRLDWGDDEKASKDARVKELALNTLLKTSREKHVHIWYSRSKYIVWSKAVTMVTVHSILEYIDNKRIAHVPVEKRDALVHHYRHWQDEPGKSPATRVFDRRLHKYYGQIVSRVMARHQRVQKYKGDSIL